VNVLDSVVEETYNIFVKRVLGTRVNIRYNVHLRYKRHGHEFLLKHAKDAGKAVLRKLLENFDEVCLYFRRGLVGFSTINMFSFAFLSLFCSC